MLNNVTIAGRLVRPIELKQTQNGVPVTSFTVACDRDYKDADGSYPTDFINCQAWRKTAEFLQKYFQKGDMVIVNGRMQCREYTAKDGSKRIATELIASNVYFCGSKRNSENSGTYNGQQSQYPQQRQGQYQQYQGQQYPQQQQYNGQPAYRGNAYQQPGTNYAATQDGPDWKDARDDGELPF